MCVRVRVWLWDVAERSLASRQIFSICFLETERVGLLPSTPLPQHKESAFKQTKTQWSSIASAAQRWDTVTAAHSRQVLALWEPATVCTPSSSWFHPGVITFNIPKTVSLCIVCVNRRNKTDGRYQWPLSQIKSSIHFLSSSNWSENVLIFS